MVESDPYLWLEDVTGEAALAWVRGQNAATQAAYEDAALLALRDRLVLAYNSEARIPRVTKRGAYVYNFWTDAKHPRGLWRRTSPESYHSLEPAWETLLDVDALGVAEQESWVWMGVQWPESIALGRVLISLSRGGTDAFEVREFDVEGKRFVEGGFSLPESKGSAEWLDADTLLISRDFGPATMNASGYPRQVRLLKRGQALADAELLLEIAETDVFVFAYAIHTQGHSHVLFEQCHSFFSKTQFLWRQGALLKLEVPDHADLGFLGEQLLIYLRQEWLGFPGGSLIAAPLEAVLSGSPTYEALFAPSERVALADWTRLRDSLVLTIVDNVRHRLESLRFAGAWQWQAVALPTQGTAQSWPLEQDKSDVLEVVVSDHLTPSTLLEVDLAAGAKAQMIKATPAFFDATGLHSQQLEAISADGTRIPYTVVSRDPLELNGQHPTLLYGYGGFEVSELPFYDVGAGMGWLERGGVYVVANIRGGGEFGPAWHQSALKEHRQRCFDDFIAVAEDVIERGFTSSQKLGIMGGSNGGLLVGAVTMQRPELFAAVVCQVPLLDMQRYHLLLAGASWMSEYGNPDLPEEWAFLQRYSPYQNVRQGVTYPPILFTTSTRDDRVHPGHARKMAARLQALGQRVWLFENIEGGHAGAADNAQLAFKTTLAYRFLQHHLE